MQMIKTAMQLDWAGWVRGVFAALISGGAGSITSGFAANLADPAHDISIFKVMWITFLLNGIIGLAAFLKQEPVPNVVPPAQP